MCCGYKKKSKIVYWIWIFKQNHWIEVIQKDPDVKKDTRQSLDSGFFCNSMCFSQDNSFLRSHVELSEHFLCNYSTRYPKQSGQLVAILWIKWADSYSHTFPITLLHSCIDSTHHVIPICYYCSLGSWNLGSFSELRLLSSGTATKKTGKD